jgi:hypothetical protein
MRCDEAWNQSAVAVNVGKPSGRQQRTIARQRKLDEHPDIARLGDQSRLWARLTTCPNCTTELGSVFQDSSSGILSLGLCRGSIFSPATQTVSSVEQVHFGPGLAVVQVFNGSPGHTQDLI